MKNYYIILRGPAGIGKSTIVKLLSSKIKAEVFHIDNMLDRLNLGYKQGEKWVPLNNFLEVDKKIISEINKKIKHKKIIIEGNFYHKEHIKDLLKSINSKNYIFTLKASVKTCIERDSKRNSIGKKNIKDVHKLVSKFDEGILINTDNKNKEEIVKEIISYIKNEQSKNL